MADPTLVPQLRTRAQQIRNACNTAGNWINGTTDACAAAADELERLAARLAAAPGDPKLQRTAQRVLGLIGDGSDLASGSSLGELAHNIAQSAKVTGIGLGVVALVVAGVFLALRFR